MLKKPTLKEIAKVTRMDYGSGDPHDSLYDEITKVINDRSEQFDLTYSGIFWALKLIDLDLTQEMLDG